jgi:hypothetical protein
MANTYTWVITQLECYPQHEGQTDVVFTIHWDRLASDGARHRARTHGSQSVTLDPDAPFTPYANLTEAQVIGWLESALGDEQLASQIAALDQQIEDQINPPVIRPPLPWTAE